MFGDLSAAVVSQTLLLCTIVPRELTTSHSGGQPPRQRHITIGLIPVSSLQPMCAGRISGLHQTVLPQSIGLDPGDWQCTIPIARSRTPKMANRHLCPGIWRACMRLPRAMLIASRRLCHFFGCHLLSRLWVEHHGAEQRHGPKVSPMLYRPATAGASSISILSPPRLPTSMTTAGGIYYLSASKAPWHLYPDLTAFQMPHQTETQQRAQQRWKHLDKD